MNLKDARLHIYKNLKILIKYHFIYFSKYVFFFYSKYMPLKGYTSQHGLS